MILTPIEFIRSKINLKKGHDHAEIVWDTEMVTKIMELYKEYLEGVKP